MPENVRYFRLNDDVGVELDYLTDPKTKQPIENPKAGELQPLTSWGLNVGVPQITKINGRDEVFDVAQRVELPDPRFGVVCPADDRVWQIHDPIVSNAIAMSIASGETPMTEVDKPKAAKAGKE